MYNASTKSLVIILNAPTLGKQQIGALRGGCRLYGAESVVFQDLSSTPLNHRDFSSPRKRFLSSPEAQTPLRASLMKVHYHLLQKDIESGRVIVSFHASELFRKAVSLLVCVRIHRHFVHLSVDIPLSGRRVEVVQKGCISVLSPPCSHLGWSLWFEHGSGQTLYVE
jgi:hypothetical protein